MKNGSKEPDWGKFGLDGEKQPLNPVASTKVEPAKPSGDLYGGQVVDDNELFADDQVSLKIKVNFLPLIFFHKSCLYCSGSFVLRCFILIPVGQNWNAFRIPFIPK